MWHGLLIVLAASHLVLGESPYLQTSSPFQIHPKVRLGNQCSGEQRHITNALPLQVLGAGLFFFFNLPSVLVNLLNKASQGKSLPDPQPSPGGKSDGRNQVQLIHSSLKTWWKHMVGKCAGGSIHENLWFFPLYNYLCASEPLFIIPFLYCPKDQTASYSPFGAFRLSIHGEPFPITPYRAWKSFLNNI